MGPIWGHQDPGGPHVGPINFAIWALATTSCALLRVKICWNLDHRAKLRTSVSYWDTKVSRRLLCDPRLFHEMAHVNVLLLWRLPSHKRLPSHVIPHVNSNISKEIIRTVRKSFKTIIIWNEADQIYFVNRLGLQYRKFSMSDIESLG